MPISVSNVSNGCSINSRSSLFMDKSGKFINFLSYWQGIEVFGITTDGVRRVQSIAIKNITQAIISNDNSQIFALADDKMHFFERNTETGFLTLERSFSMSAIGLMAISSDNQFAFTIGKNGRFDVNLFRLEPGSGPVLVGELDQLPRNLHWRLPTCSFTMPRRELPAVDIFCSKFAFTLQWHPETGKLVSMDQLAVDELDRYGNLVPDFGEVKAGLASPDGRHVYLATENGSLVSFERVGNAGAQVSTAPVLTAETGSLHLPLAEFRDQSASLCFSAELRGESASGNWLDSANWTLAAGATKNCEPAAGGMPFVEAKSRILRIPHGKIFDEDGMTCFTAELQASEDWQDWTLLAANYRDCQ